MPPALFVLAVSQSRLHPFVSLSTNCSIFPRCDIEYRSRCSAPSTRGLPHAARLPRRVALRLLLLLLFATKPAIAVSASDTESSFFQSNPPFRSLSRGVIGADVGEPGKGPPVSVGSRVSAKYVLRRSNGYFVDASYGFDRFENFAWTAGVGEVIEGFDGGVMGMREGERRRFVVKPEVGYVDGVRKGARGPIPPEWGPRRALASHTNEPLVFEVLVVKVSETKRKEEG